MVNFARCGSRQAVGRQSLLACLMKRYPGGKEPGPAYCPSRGRDRASRCDA
jgi:hypothetical protein